MLRPIVQYETERLILKPTGIEDAKFIYALLNSPGWLEHIGDRKVYSPKEAKRYIEDRMLPQYQEKGFGNYTVILKDDQSKIGTCGVYVRPGMDDVDIGFSILPQYMKNGYSYEAAVKMIWLAKHEFGIKHITAITTRANITSQNLIQKLGMQFIKDIELEGDEEVLMQFGMAL